MIKWYSADPYAASDVSNIGGGRYAKPSVLTPGDLNDPNDEGTSKETKAKIEYWRKRNTQERLEEIQKTEDKKDRIDGFNADDFHCNVLNCSNWHRNKNYNWYTQRDDIRVGDTTIGVYLDNEYLESKLYFLEIYTKYGTFHTIGDTFDYVPNHFTKYENVNDQHMR